MATQAQCQKALDLFEGQLSRLKNVVGLGIVEAEDDTPKSGKDLAVAVYVKKKLPEGKLPAKDRVPPVLTLPVHGKVVEVPTRVIEEGEFSLE
jgi:hypothetical protein